MAEIADVQRLLLVGHQADEPLAHGEGALVVYIGGEAVAVDHGEGLAAGIELKKRGGEGIGDVADQRDQAFQLVGDVHKLVFLTGTKPLGLRYSEQGAAHCPYFQGTLDQKP